MYGMSLFSAVKDHGRRKRTMNLRVILTRRTLLAGEAFPDGISSEGYFVFGRCRACVWSKSLLSDSTCYLSFALFRILVEKISGCLGCN